MSRNASGFTLIEMLVVITVIAILAGLLLPALSRGKAAARATECKNNLRDIGLAMRMYLDDGGDRYPTTSGIGILYGREELLDAIDSVPRVTLEELKRTHGSTPVVTAAFGGARSSPTF